MGSVLHPCGGTVNFTKQKMREYAAMLESVANDLKVYAELLRDPTKHSVADATSAWINTGPSTYAGEAQTVVYDLLAAEGRLPKVNY